MPTDKHSLKGSLALGDKMQQQNLRTYKKNLLYKVILVLVILSIFVLERIFYWYLQDYEVTLLLNVQSGLSIYQLSPSQSVFRAFSYMASQRYYLILQTHFYVTVYCGVDGILSLKIMTMHFLGVYLMNLVVLLYAGGRPYWISPGIVSYQCLDTYSHPSLMAFSLLFWLAYSYQCYSRTRSQVALISFHSLPLHHRLHKALTALFVLSILWFLALLVMDYLQGNMFLLNLFLALCMFAVYFLLIFQVDSQVNNLIKKFTIMKLEAKKNIFYWLLFVIIAQLLSYVVYTNNSDMDDIIMVKQYIHCANLNHLQHQYNHLQNQKDLIGPYQQYQQNFILLPLLGAILGAAKTFQKLVTVHWFRGSFKSRIGRVLLSNLCVIPLWVIYCLPDSVLLHNHGLAWLGLNAYSINCVVYFLAYYFLFGVLPSHVFPRLKLTTIQLSHFNQYRAVAAS